MTAHGVQLNNYQRMQYTVSHTILHGPFSKVCSSCIWWGNHISIHSFMCTHTYICYCYWSQHIL